MKAVNSSEKESGRAKLLSSLGFPAASHLRFATNAQRLEPAQHRQENRLDNMMSFQTKQLDTQKSNHDYSLSENVIKCSLTQVSAI